jgi:glycine/D-amino acid oxidase-like deaminating enzyme
MINTGKMMRTLVDLTRKAGIQIMNGVTVEKLFNQSNQVSVLLDNNWEINAERVIVATNGFARQLLPELSIRPARNLVLITDPIKGLKIKGAFHGEGGYFYFRNIDNRILLGGGRHLDLKKEETSEFGENKLIKKALLELLDTTILPEIPYTIDRWWSGILGVGEQKKPIVERQKDRLVVAVRMGGMGVAIGSSVGVMAIDKLTP